MFNTTEEILRSVKYFYKHMLLISTLFYVFFFFGTFLFISWKLVLIMIHIEVL